MWIKKFFNNIHNIKDFDKDEKIAKKWSDDFSRHWEGSLTNKQRKSINNYSQNSRNYNAFLRKYYDVFEHKPDYISKIDWEQTYKNINNDIKNIDQELAKSMVEEAIVVYRRVDLTQFYSQSQISDLSLKLRDEQGKINLNLFQKIKQEFINNKKGYYEPTFISTSLNRDPTNDPSPTKIVLGWKPILLKIAIPVGTNAAFIDNISYFPKQNEILIARRQLLQYENIAIISDDFDRETALVSLMLLKK